MRRVVFLVVTCAVMGAFAAEAPPAASEQVEALSDDELDALEAPADGGVAELRVRPVPTEHDYQRALMALPLLLVALLAWNVEWKRRKP